MQIKVKPFVLMLVLSVILLCGVGGAAQVFSTTVPISFIQNDGQTDEQVLYFADAAGYTLYLTHDGEVISTAEPFSVLTISYMDSSSSVIVTPEDELAGKANFLIGYEDAWVTNVPMYGSVRYDGLYDGISLLYRGGPGILKKEFIVEPGADLSAIVMKYVGQEEIALDENGALLVTTGAGTFVESPPVSTRLSMENRLIFHARTSSVMMGLSPSECVHTIMRFHLLLIPSMISRPTWVVPKTIKVRE